MKLVKGILVLVVVTAVRSASLSSNHEIVESETNVSEPADSNTKGEYQDFSNVKDELKYLRTRLQMIVKEICSVIATGNPPSGNIGEVETDDPSKPQGSLSHFGIPVIDRNLPRPPKPWWSHSRG
ncbi:hypothetical protein FKM82_007285 [Ascaphus truei]